MRVKHTPAKMQVYALLKLQHETERPKGGDVVNTFFNILKKLEKYSLMILMIAFTIISFLQVVFRLVLQQPLAWSEEASRYLFVWSTFLGAVVVLTKDEHFKIDFIIELFPKSFKKLFIYFTYLCIVAFTIVLIKYGVELQQAASNQLSPALRLNMSWVYVIIPISGVLMLVHLVEFIYNDFTKKKTVD